MYVPHIEHDIEFAAPHHAQAELQRIAEIARTDVGRVRWDHLGSLLRPLRRCRSHLDVSTFADGLTVISIADRGDSAAFVAVFSMAVIVKGGVA